MCVVDAPSECSQEGHLSILSPEPCSGFSWMTGPSGNPLEILGGGWVGSYKHLFLKSLGSCDPHVCLWLEEPSDYLVPGLSSQSSPACALGLRGAELGWGTSGKQRWQGTVVSGTRSAQRPGTPWDRLL